MKKAVFLDRDNTINEDPGYLHDPGDVVLKKGAGEAIRMLKDAGFLIIVVSNQSGVGRGYFGTDAVEAVNRRVAELLSAYGAEPHAFYYCPHTPEEDCVCRKPEIGLFLEAGRDFEIDTQGSYMVGDKMSDVEFGKKAGIRSILLSEKSDCGGADYCAKDLADAAGIILSRR